ncbi:MAG: TlpA family protein disulfide reductase [Saprospiraceae bacterium]|nr:TlpA family protein disulfide reductase [Saprospiraceae bacterium]
MRANMTDVPAPDIAQTDTSGVVRKLSDLKGKIVLIDFWASWCGPCRKENPTVVAAYKKYRDKGFEVFSVSLDQDRTRWINAIEQDGLIWSNHVSDLRYWQNEAATKYGVTSIPKTVLLDRNGIITDHNLRGEALVKKLKDIFGE